MEKGRLRGRKAVYFSQISYYRGNPAHKLIQRKSSKTKIRWVPRKNSRVGCVHFASGKLEAVSDLPTEPLDYPYWRSVGAETRAFQRIARTCHEEHMYRLCDNVNEMKARMLRSNLNKSQKLMTALSLKPTVTYAASQVSSLLTTITHRTSQAPEGSAYPVYKTLSC